MSTRDNKHSFFLYGICNIMYEFPSCKKTMFFKLSFPKNFAIFAGKQLCWSLSLIKRNFMSNFIKRLPHWLFCEIAKNFKNTFFYRITPVATSGIYTYTFFIKATPFWGLTLDLLWKFMFSSQRLLRSCLEISKGFRQLHINLRIFSIVTSVSLKYYCKQLSCAKNICREI